MPEPDIRSTVLGEKTFSAQDQQHFAAASRDWNPMHVDAIAARRLLSGGQVVHGMHTLVHALNLCSAPAALRQPRFSCRFANPVSVGQRVVFSQSVASDARASLSATVEGLVCTEIEIEIEPEPAPDASAPGRPQADAGLPRRRITALDAPLDEPPGSQLGQVFELPAWPDDLAERFPQAAALLGAGRLSALGQLSFFVGMVCPGLHSVFSSLQFCLGSDAAGEMRFQVRKYDARMRLFVVAFDGPLRGELRAFLRPPPQQQPSAQDVAQHVSVDEFKGTRALVIGGSRGLGETTAKIIAAGGGEVVVSYAVGREDAEAVAADIKRAGRGHCSTLALDLSRPFTGVHGVQPTTLDAVYYFATPRIFSKRGELFDRAAFDAFVDFYLVRLHELCRWLDAGPRERPLVVYLPSTVFLDERPRGMTEYTMAKAAAEVLAEDLNRSLRHVKLVHTRLPRLATDQTASILKVEVGSNLDAMLAVVRQISNAINSL